ncbi:MAG: hypothetical protein ACYC3F_00980 [Gemmatimonadaceae bacterium]
MTHEEQLDPCHCGLDHWETMDELLAALAKVETLRPFLPHEELWSFDRLAAHVRSMENLCERRAYVMRVITLTTIILCEGHYRNYDRDWPGGEGVLTSLEDWAFDYVSPEELSALCALPGAARLAHLLVAGNVVAPVREAVAPARTS